MFEDKDKEKKYVWQTSWGMTTRTVGTLVMVHSDNKGLILPPRVAPIKIAIVPIIFKDGKEEVLSRCKEVQELLGKKYKVKLDDREGYTAGFKFNEWELKGIPIRIEIGPRDVKENKVVVVRRDNSQKIFLSMENLSREIDSILEDIQSTLFSNAKDFLRENTFLPKDYNELSDILNNQKGMAKVSWCERGCCEEKIKEETGATSCCIPLDQNGLEKKCIVCGEEAKKVILFAKHY
jgi:prolyl-tRNA synthetase